jgi:tetratricopeptide (TPR) repeat protein
MKCSRSLFLVSLCLATTLLAETRIAPGPFAVNLKNQADGKPLGGIYVLLGGREVVSDSSGVATFDGVPAGKYALTILHPNFELVEHETDLPAGGRKPIELLLTPRVTTAASGTVKVEGQGGAIAGARIGLKMKQTKASLKGDYALATDWEGKFFVIDVPVGWYRVSLSAPGFADKEFDLEIKPKEPAAAFTLARLSSPAAMTVTVREAGSGKPVANAEVVLAEAYPSGKIAEGRTDAQGHVTFAGLKLGQINWNAAEVSRPQITVSARAAGYENAVVPTELKTQGSCTVVLNATNTIAPAASNLDIASAQAIPTGVPVQFKIAKNGEQRFFCFQLAQPASVQLKIAKAPIETIQRLLTPEGKMLRERGAYANSDNVIDAGALAAGDYIVQAAEWGDNAAMPEPLALTVNITPAPDPFEPSNTIAFARPIRCNEEVRGCLCPAGDVDWFRFEAPRAGHVRITMPSNPLERFVELCDAKGKRIAEAACHGNGIVSLVAGLNRGVYHIVVHEWGDNGESTVPYTLRLEMITDDGVDDPPARPGYAGAVRELALNGLASSYIFPNGNIHRYLVNLPSAGRLHFTGTAPIELQAILRAGNGKQLADAACYANGALRGSWETGGPTTVILEVHKWGDNGCSPSPYVLRSFFEPCDEGERFGRNDTADMATPLQFTESIRANIMPTGDVDWYRLQVDHPGVMRLSGKTHLEMLAHFTDPKKRVLVERGWYGGTVGLTMDTPVLPGDYFLDVHDWGDNNAHPIPHELKVSLLRAEPQETVPLATDPIRTLTLGEAQAFWIDQIGDRDRFVFDIAAGTFSLRIRIPVEVMVQLFDDRTGARVHAQGFYGGSNHKLDFTAKGPTRYRLEFEKWGNNGVSPAPGYVMVDITDREIAAETVTSSNDPTEPTQVKFVRTDIRGFPRGAKVTVDPAGTGRQQIDVPGGFRYPAEGVYPAVATVEAANGTRTRIPFWVEATGPRERKGVYAVLDYPGEGQVIDSDKPARARAISYTGAPIARMTLAVDGQPPLTSHSRPFTFDVPWETLGSGAHALTITATDAKGATAQIERSIRVSDYFDLQPTDGTTVSGNEVRVRWKGSAFGGAQVRYRAAGSNEWRTVTGESGRNRTVALRDLEAGKPYEFQPLGGVEPGPMRTVTRVKGLAFSAAKFGGLIRRSYDQKLPIAVRNHGEKPLSVRLECGKPPEDSKLLVGFVGEGSEGAPFDLKPGEQREFFLGLSAQDVSQPQVKFPIKLLSADGALSDEAEVEVQVRLPVVKLRWEDLGAAPTGLAHRFRLHNEGDPLTDLALATDPGLIMNPAMSHGFLQAGQAVDVSVKPQLYDGFKSVTGRVRAKAVDKESPQSVTFTLPPGQSIYDVAIVPGMDLNAPEPSAKERAAVERWKTAANHDPAAVNWTAKENPQDIDGDGRPDRWQVVEEKTKCLWVGDDTNGDGQIDFVHADPGATGIFEYSAFKTETGWERTNLVEAWLELSFTLPWARSAYEKHDVDVVFNDRIIGRLRDMIPEGNHTFRIPPEIIRFGVDGRPADNSIQMQTQHLRGGHYVVGNEFHILARMIGSREWVVADSPENARAQLKNAKGLAVDTPDYSISSAEIQLAGELAKGREVIVTAPIRNVGAAGTDTLTVALVRSLPGERGVELTRTEIEAPMTGRVVASLPWKAAPGQHTLKVVVDPDNDFGETNRGNNEAVVSLAIAGEDAKPTLIISAPVKDAVLADTLCPLEVRADDDTGVAKVEAQVDGGLWRELAVAAPPVFGGIVVVQPGAHDLRVRVTDSGGNQVEQSVPITIQAPVPDAEWIGAVDGRDVHGRSLPVRLKIGEGSTLAAVRVNNGPWRSMDLAGNEVAGEVLLNYGANVVEAAVANDRGATRTLKQNVNCTTQPRSDEVPPQVEVEARGVIPVGGGLAIDILATPNGVVGKPVDPALYKLQAEERTLMEKAAAAPSAEGITKQLAELRWKIGNLYAGKLDFEMAQRYIANSVRLDPAHAQRWDMLGDLYNFSREPVAAYFQQNAYEEALKLEPGRTECRFKLATSCMSTDRFEKAAEELETLARGDGGKPDGQYLGLLGAIYAHQGEVKRAQDFCQEMLAKGGDNRFRAALAINDNLAGDKETAVRLLQQIETEEKAGAQDRHSIANYAAQLRESYLNPPKPPAGPIKDPPVRRESVPHESLGPVERIIAMGDPNARHIGRERQAYDGALQRTLAEYEAKIPQDAYNAEGAVNEAHPEYLKTKARWEYEMQVIHDTYAPRFGDDLTDWRVEEHDRVLTELQLEGRILDDEDGDMDSIHGELSFVATDEEAAQKYLHAVQAKGYRILEREEYWLIENTDATLWKPEPGAKPPVLPVLDDNLLAEAPARLSHTAPLMPTVFASVAPRTAMMWQQIAAPLPAAAGEAAWIQNLRQGMTQNARGEWFAPEGTVMEIMQHPEQVRHLNENAPSEVKEAFDRARQEIYRRHDTRLTNEVKNSESFQNWVKEHPELAGKEVKVVEFGTPGAKPGEKLNTDRDYRAVVETEPGVYVEIPRQKTGWDQTSYKIFAEETGCPNPSNPEAARHWAEARQQLGTDAIHGEASMDFKDQGHIRYNEKTGTLEYTKSPSMESNASRVMKGRGKLQDPTGLGKMYETKVGDAVKNYGQGEGFSQARKALEMLGKIRNGYSMQGYDVGKLHEGLQKAARAVQAAAKTPWDPKAIAEANKALNECGFSDINSFTQELSKQFEWLKIAQKKPGATNARTGQKPNGGETPTGKVTKAAQKASDGGISVKDPAKVNPRQVAEGVRKAGETTGTAKDNPGVHQKSQEISRGRTPEEAGVNKFGDKPEAKARQTREHLNESSRQLQRSNEAARRQTQQNREQVQREIERLNREGRAEQARQLQREANRMDVKERARVNELARNDPKLTEKMTGIDPRSPKGREALMRETGKAITRSGTHDVPAPHELVVHEPTPGEAFAKWGGRVMTGLWVLNSGATGWEKEVDQALQEGREPSKLRALANGAWELTMIPAALGSIEHGFQLRDKFLDEADRQYGNNHWGVEARLLAWGEAFKELSCWNLGTQIANEEIRAEEARARAAGEEPDYWRSWGNGTLRGLGEVFMINGICRAMTRDWEAELNAVQADEALRQHALFKTQMNMRDLDNLREQIRKTLEHGNPKDFMTQIRLQSLQDQYDKALNNIHDIAKRMRKMFGTDDPLTKALYDELGRLKGRKKGKAGYVSADGKQADWYCTNRPHIKVNAPVPPQVSKGE